MSLTGRFSTLFLSALGVILVGFSLALYISARVYLSRQLGERLAASLAVLAAAAEIHPNGVEWEPQERVLPLGQDFGPERVRWMVFDNQGRRVDHSRNLVDSEFTPDWIPRPGSASLPNHLRDSQHRVWRVEQREISAAPASQPAEPKIAAGETNLAGALYPSLVLTACAPVAPVEATLGTLAWFLATLSSAVWLASALLCQRLSRKALAPLTKLVESARGLDAADPGWCLDEVGTRDELDELGRAFNELLSRLHLAYQRQERFSSDASHQLRTPLTVLIGQLDVALRRDRPAAEYQRVLKSALRRANELAQTVESLLLLARAHTHALVPGAECCDLSHLVADHLASRSGADAGPKVILTSAENAPLWVIVNVGLFEQMFENLLDNARKHGQPDARVVVEVFRQGDEAVLAVEDTGPGVSASELELVFEPFYRSAQARRRAVPGVGLGLAVVKQIATAFGGSIGLRSEPGRGARFEVRLPLTKSELPETSAPDGLAMGANPCKLRSPLPSA
jgi:signal transduction histidine kinase